MMSGRPRLLPALALAAVLSLLPAAGRCGKVGSTLARYSIAGAGIGALLGAVAGTIPWLSSRQTWDFITGAGAGVVVGSGVGFIGGIIELNMYNENSGGAEEKESLAPAEGLLAWKVPGGGGLVWLMRF